MEFYLCVQKRNDKQNHDNYNEPAFLLLLVFFVNSREKKKKNQQKNNFFVCECNGEFVALVLVCRRK